MQGSYQQRQERERKDMEQAHMKIVKQMESRLYEMEGVNKVLCRIGSESSIDENVLLQNTGSSYWLYVHTYTYGSCIGVGVQF